MTQLSFLLLMFQVLGNLLGLVLIFEVVAFFDLPWYANVALVALALAVLWRPIMWLNRSIYGWVERQ